MALSGREHQSNSTIQQHIDGIVVVFVLLLCEAEMRVCLESWAEVRSPVFKTNEII